MMNLHEVRELIDTDKLEEALSQIQDLLSREKQSPYLWILRGDLIRLLNTENGPPLHEAAESYLNALALNPNDLEALESLAHFYAAVDRNPGEARKYANAYLEKAKDSVAAMECILTESP
jgi:predicted Zn-dependent protease